MVWAYAIIGYSQFDDNHRKLYVKARETWNEKVLRWLKGKKWKMIYEGSRLKVEMVENVNE